MTTYDDNRSLIRGLWPKAEISKELADLFSERLQPLDQDLLSDALKLARIESRYPTPDLGEILESYSKQRRLSHVATKSYSAAPPPKQKMPDVDKEAERKIVQEARSLIKSSQPEDADCIRDAIWDRWEAGELSSAKCSTLLSELLLMINGGPGISRIGDDGEPEPLRQEVTL
jgi:hypothetical protein